MEANERLVEENDTTLTLLDVFWDDILFKYLLPYLTTNDYFNLRLVSRRFETFIGEYLTTLKNINLSDSKDSTIASTEKIKVLADNCRNLRSLSLPGLQPVDTECLQELVLRNQCISFIDLSCSQKWSSCYRIIVSTCRSVRSLKMQRCHWLKSRLLDVLIDCQSQLAELDLSFCSHVDEAGLQRLVGSLCRLEKLVLSHVVSTTDAVMVSIAEGCPELRYLDVSHCPDVARVVGVSCRQLRTLLVEHCCIDPHAIQFLQRRTRVDVPKTLVAAAQDIPQGVAL